MKLQEGNVFRHVWLFTDGSHVTITHDALNFTIEESPGPGHPPGHGTSLYQDPPASPHGHETSLYGDPCPSPATDIWWPRLEIC